MPWVDGSWRGDDPSLAALIPEPEDRECACCEAKGVPLKVYIFGSATNRYRQALEEGVPPFKALCFLCASTPAGNRDDYSYCQGDTLDLMKHINFVANEIIRRCNVRR